MTEDTRPCAEGSSQKASSTPPKVVRSTRLRRSRVPSYGRIPRRSRELWALARLWAQPCYGRRPVPLAGSRGTPVGMGVSPVMVEYPGGARSYGREAGIPCGTLLDRLWAEPGTPLGDAVIGNPFSLYPPVPYGTARRGTPLQGIVYHSRFHRFMALYWRE